MSISVKIKNVPVICLTALLVIGGMLGYSAYSLFPFSAYVLEFFTSLTIILSLRKIHLSELVLLYVTLFTIVMKVVTSLIYDVHLLDFLIAHKFLFYLVLLFTFNPIKPVFSDDFVLKFYRFLSTVVVVKYIVWTLLVNNRPGFVTENNFELLFMAIFYVALREKKLSRPFDMFLLLCIFILSNSRSGLAILFLIIVNYQALSNPSLLKFVLASLLGIIVLGTFLQRIPSDLSSIDRIIFMLNFISTIKFFEPIELLFGPLYLKPLPVQICANLQFYEALFSASGDGSCYSVIFHSFILRLLHDFGVFGLVFTCVSYFVVIRKCFDLKATLLLSGLLFLNALSVSGPNNAFAFTGLVLAMSIVGNRENDALYA